MPDFAAALGASKAASALLVLFILSKDRRNKPINQKFWVNEALNALGNTVRRGDRLSTRRRASGVTTPRAASFCLMSRLLSIATRAST